MPLRRGDRLAQEVEHRDAGDLLGVLEAEEQAARGRARRSGRSVMSSPSSRMRPRGDLVGGVAEQGVGERRLAGAVRAHQGVERARRRPPGSRPRRISRSSTATWRSSISRAGSAGGSGRRGHRPRRHCNNTTAVVEISGIGVYAGCERPARRPPRSPAPSPRPRSSSSTRRRHAGGSRVADPADRLDEVVVAVAAKAGDAVVDELGRRAPVGGDDRRAARHRFDHHEPERLRPADREHHRAGPAEQVDLLSCDTFSYSSTSLASSGSISCSKYSRSGGSLRFRIMCSGKPGAARDRDRFLRALVGVRAPDVDEEVVLVLAERVRDEVDAVVHGADVAARRGCRRVARR